jgi:N-hydroxyarylamine O-acetyltransferase
MTLLVDLDERWLADVGFGESFLEPLRFDDSEEQTQQRGVFRVQHDGFEGVHARQTHSGDWHSEYLFRLQPRTLADFEPGCHHHQYSPTSHFTQQRFCTQANAQGRVTLSDRRLIVTENGHRREQDLESEAEFQSHLRDHFGITLS